MMATTARLTVSLFGTFEVALVGEPVTTFEYDKVRALLAYLVVESDRPHRRETLAGLLWPDQPERKARHSLSQTLFTLRRTIGDRRARPSFLDITAQTLQFNSLSDYELDVTQFSTLLAACQTHDHDQLATCESCLERLQQAIALYRGSLLEGFSLGDSPPFEEWIVLNRERYHRLAIEALGRLTDSYEARGLYEAALEYAWRQLELDLWRETAQRQLMRLLALSGQKEAALAQFDSCRQVLKTELGLEPAAETVALAETIRQGTLEAVGPGPHRPPVPDRTVFTPHNLPPQPTPFVGRDQELAQISAHLADPDCRLLTLVGPGGIGKTRLAVQAAERILQSEAFPHGIYFVPLASVGEPEFLVSALAAAVGFSFLGQEDPAMQLLNFLRVRQLLLILDNFEHLLAGIGLLVDLLNGTQAVKLLVTSRERLNLREEWLLDVQGLRFPDDKRSEIDSPETYSAVQLFVQSASRLRTTFNLTRANAPHVVRICRLVEGMPLGIELAASWIRTLTCGQIVQELERGLYLLTTSLQDMPQRHRSLRAVFEHSWQLLPDQERQLFRQMALFRGGFSKYAAEQVAGASLPSLSALVDKSFLRRTRGGRYHVHDLLRHFAAEKLDQLPEEKQEVQKRHCGYYTAFLQQREQALIGPTQQEALTEIGTEIENVRAAWSWAVEQSRLEEIERSLEGLFRFYVRQSWYQEGYDAFQPVAKVLVGIRQPEHLLIAGRVLARQGVCCSHRFDFKQARELLEQSLVILNQAGPIAQKEIAFALMHLGDVAFDLGAYPEAQQRLQASLKIHRETGDQWGMAFSLAVLSYLAYTRGDYLEAKQQAQESLAIFSEIGDQWGIAYAQNAVGLVTYLMGDYAEAKQHLQKCLMITKDINDRFISLFASINLGRIALALGKYDEAKQLLQQEALISSELGLRRGFLTLSRLSQLARIQGKYQEARQCGWESMVMAKAAGHRRGMASALNSLGCLAYLQGEYSQAEQWLQASLTLRQEIGYRRGVAESLGNLGKVAVAQDSLQDAGEYFRHALQIAVDIQAKGIVLDILTGIAGLLVKEMAVERAVELLTLALDHPSSEQGSKDRAKKLLAESESDLPALVVAAAQASGRVRLLEEVAAELLDHSDWRELVKQ